MKLTAPVKTVLKFVMLSIAILSLSRVYLLLTHVDRINGFSDGVWILLQGLRVDLVVAGYFFTIPLMVSLWLYDGAVSRFITRILNVWLVAAFTAIVFLEVITPEFIHEYDIRPNRLFIDYLAYPGEVSRMLWEGYKPAIFLSLFALAVCIGAGIAMTRKKSLPDQSLKILRRFGLTFVVLIIGFAAMRSSLQHRPFNPSMVYFTNDNLVNSLALNSTYSVLYAAYNAKSERQASALYGKMPASQVIENVRATADINQSQFVSQDIPTLRYHEASYKGKPKNIVILLQESLGSRYVGSLGGENLTPNLDKLMAGGWQFTNAFATGTRSVRGIEAVFSGFPPGPSRSVVKLSKSQNDFFTIASLLKTHGYFTQFIYGGESHFDNMKSFFLGNGITDIHDLSTFKDPKFVGSWGASDEDLYQEAHRQFEKLNRDSVPFFSLVFTTSNHSPWEFPEDCGNDLVAPKQSRENAIRYSDCALGKFFEQAKESDYWEDTLFLVIADHDSRAYGSDLVPIEHFRIPALLIGKDVPPRKDDRLVSQIDFPVTLLSMAGISDFHPMTGFDLTQDIPESRQRAMMQYGENFAWMDMSQTTIFRPNLAPKIFTHDLKHLNTEVLADHKQKLLDKVHAHALWSNLAYLQGLYRLPSDEAFDGLEVTSLEQNEKNLDMN